ncbi:DNA polymerase III subunit delta' [Vagococcus sp. PNs007]|uniref:DNA polymerase III subunit delta n=1 Tax=Vagococcus proximus TaxID=2991417 RepID=A0ABT5WYA7_9ENTE|nr:DNA polymerase III subunit delta' [Vagococcus proximus]MDF0478704.1 DNA polymerase III subunit delta' [Vagococcus proximus]
MLIQKKQPIVCEQLQASIEANRLTHAYLFEGSEGTGKRELVEWFSQGIFCLSDDKKPCGECINCTRILAGDHPDVITIIPDGQTIKVDQIRDIKATFTKSGMEGQKKIVVITEAEKMSVSAANSLLKFIEEPDGQIVIMFITTSKARILPTIQSRCQIFHLMPLSKELLVETLKAEGISSQDAEFLARMTNSQSKAIEFYQNEWFNEAKVTVSKWVDYILADNLFAMVYVQQYIVKVFKEKDQQALLFEMLIIFFREELTRKITGTQPTSRNSRWSQKKLLVGLETILTSRQKIEANVSFQNVCEQLAIKLIDG